MNICGFRSLIVSEACSCFPVQPSEGLKDTKLSGVLKLKIKSTTFYSYKKKYISINDKLINISIYNLLESSQLCVFFVLSASCFSYSLVFSFLSCSTSFVGSAGEEDSDCLETWEEAEWASFCSFRPSERTDQMIFTTNASSLVQTERQRNDFILVGFLQRRAADFLCVACFSVITSIICYWSWFPDVLRDS